MFFVLVFSAAFATSHTPAYDEILVDHPATFQAFGEVAGYEPICDVRWLQGDGVIDLVEPPPLMPAPVAAPAEPLVRAASSVAAVSVEARTRE